MPAAATQRTWRSYRERLPSPDTRPVPPQTEVQRSGYRLADRRRMRTASDCKNAFVSDPVSLSIASKFPCNFPVKAAFHQSRKVIVGTAPEFLVPGLQKILSCNRKLDVRDRLPSQAHIEGDI